MNESRCTTNLAEGREYLVFFFNPLLAKILQAVMGILLSLILGIFKNKTHYRNE